MSPPGKNALLSYRFAHHTTNLDSSPSYRKAEVYLKSRLVPKTADELLSVKNINTNEALRICALEDIYTYFTGPNADLQAPVL
jgi:hypothetical protein